MALNPATVAKWVRVGRSAASMAFSNEKLQLRRNLTNHISDMIGRFLRYKEFRNRRRLAEKYIFLYNVYRNSLFKLCPLFSTE
jgi:hypothetical protein